MRQQFATHDVQKSLSYFFQVEGRSLSKYICLILRNLLRVNQGLDFALKCSHMRKLLYVAFILLTLGQTAAFANQCVNQLSARKAHFEFIDYRIELGQGGGRMYLGSGFHADVVLHLDKLKNKWMVLKKYRFHQEHGREIDPTPFMESDIKAALIVSQLSDRHPFKVVTYNRHAEDPHMIELDYHAGITLEQLLLNQRLNKEIKDSLVGSFDSGVQSLKAELEKKNFENIKIVKMPSKFSDAIIMNTLQAEKTIGGTKVHIWIKPDNIIVDPYTLELILIDPH